MPLSFKISGYNRRRKYAQFLRTFPVDARTTILDVGYTSSEYTGYENYLERNYPYPGSITALGTDDPALFHKSHPGVRAVRYDGRIFPFADKQFDICWSNAVIEHVGDYDRQLLFLKEVKRTSRAAFLTTPNRYFPFEVHTRIPLLHWLPRNIFNRILPVLGKDFAAGDYMFLLSLGRIRQLLADAGIGNYTVTRNRILGFTMDFVITIKD
jgi:SAM-dependent methyltransferase